MIRIIKIIPREKIFNMMNMEYTHHVEIRKKDSERLTNPDVVRARIFVGGKTENARREQFNGVIGNMKKYIIDPPQGLDNSILKGMVAQQSLGYFSVSHINKLIKLKNQYKLQLSIPKYWLKLTKEYTEL